MFKDFLVKKLLKSKLKDIPEAEQDRFIALIQKNPELFQRIALEVQEKMKNGADQMSATMEVMKSHEGELKSIL